MIERLLQRMNEAAVVDLGLETAPEPGAPGGEPAALRFTTPFYYRPPGRPFQVSLLLDPARLPDGGTLTFEADLPGSLAIKPAPVPVPVAALAGTRRLEWTATGERAGDRGELTVRVGDYWALCELVIAEHASQHAADQPPHPAADGAAGPEARPPQPAGATGTTGPTGPAAGSAPGSGGRNGPEGAPRPSRDHGVDLFTGYDFRRLHDSAGRAVYDPAERKVIINTAAPTVQLYVDGRGRFRDSARLLLAELFLDVIADELARRRTAQRGRAGDLDAFRNAKRDIIRRYGSDIHRTFLG